MIYHTPLLISAISFGLKPLPTDLSETVTSGAFEDLSIQYGGTVSMQCPLVANLFNIAIKQRA